jgi:hypothetical protein
VIVYGGASPAVMGVIVNALAGLMSRAEVIQIPEATHGMLDTHPEAVATLIEKVRNSSPPVRLR